VNVGIFSPPDLCYKTSHAFNPEFDWALAPFHRAEGSCDSNGRGCESCFCKSQQGCLLNLSQLLDRVARTPLQGGL
jgi:hypothetical protein